MNRRVCGGLSGSATSCTFIPCISLSWLFVPSALNIKDASPAPEPVPRDRGIVLRAPLRGLKTNGSPQAAELGIMQEAETTSRGVLVGYLGGARHFHTADKRCMCAEERFKKQGLRSFCRQGLPEAKERGTCLLSGGCCSEGQSADVGDVGTPDVGPPGLTVCGLRGV